MSGCGNGIYQGKQYFSCPDGRGYFCRVFDIQPLEPTADATPVLVSTSAALTNREYGM